MKEELREQMQTDVDLARSMADINSANEVLDLVNRLIGHLDLVLSIKAELTYKMNQLDGKKRVLEEFIRTGKERHRELREIARYV